MSIDNMKSMVFIKNLPSNIAEEAIVILKPNVQIKSLELVEHKKEFDSIKNEREKKSKMYIINEAEMVISNYLSKIENERVLMNSTNKKIENKYKKSKAISIVLGIVLCLSFFL